MGVMTRNAFQAAIFQRYFRRQFHHRPKHTRRGYGTGIDERDRVVIGQVSR
jgi:hypothetical protein